MPCTKEIFPRAILGTRAIGSSALAYIDNLFTHLHGAMYLKRQQRFKKIYWTFITVRTKSLLFRSKVVRWPYMYFGCLTYIYVYMYVS